MIPDIIPEARTAIRPSPQELAAMPTLCVVGEAHLPETWREELAKHGYSFRKEMKLMRLGVSYWLITKGIPPDSPLAQNLAYQCMVQGNAIFSRDGPLLPGTLPMEWYSPENTTRMQRKDYFDHLQIELLVLRQHHEKEPSAECAQRIEKVRQEAIEIWKQFREEAVLGPELTPEQIAAFKAGIPDFLHPRPQDTYSPTV